jgi:predicted AAA+ superfamily ATPase
MVARPALAARVRTAIGRSPVTVLVGPRQCGKTTLAAVVGAGRSAVTRFDLDVRLIWPRSSARRRPSDDSGGS